MKSYNCFTILGKLDGHPYIPGFSRNGDFVYNNHNLWVRDIFESIFKRILGMSDKQVHADCLICGIKNIICEKDISTIYPLQIIVYSTLSLKEMKGIMRFYSCQCLIDSTVTLPCMPYSEEVTKFVKEKNLNPVFIYEDLSVSTVITKVLNDTRYLSGIYLILNKDTSDYYVGSASTGKLYSRFSNHLFNFNGSKVVKNAVKKYGISSFAFIVLELFPEVVTKENNKKLLDLEDFYLKSLLPNYNILTEAGSSFGYKHTEITRIKMRANYSEQRRMQIGSLNKNKTFSFETREVMTKAALNKTKTSYSLEAIKNLKKKSKAILVYNLDYTVFGQFSSMIDASKSLGCDQKTIRRALQSQKKILRRRWIVKFV